jgi:hypothetical protein
MLYFLILVELLAIYPEINRNSEEKIPLADKLFPDTELIWGGTFEGKMTDFAIAEKSGHVVIGAVKDLKGCVYLFSPDGKLLWIKENVKDSKIKKCAGVAVAISDNGETISIQWGGDYEDEEVQVYDITGEKLYAHKHGMSGAGVEVSPGGGYVKHAWFFDKTGKQIILREILKELSEIRNFEFVSEKELAVLSNNILYLFSFPEGELKWKSEKLDGGGTITVQGRYILLSGDQKVHLFERDGRLIWEKGLDKELYSHTVDLSRDKKYIGIYGFPGKRRVLLLDIATGEIEIYTLELENVISLPKLLLLKNKVFLSGYTGGQTFDEMKGYCTYILNFEKNWNILNESWGKGLVLGTSTSPVIAVYESDATGETKSGYDEGVFGYENSTIFSINVLKIKD